jgi:hypothetical protein
VARNLLSSASMRMTKGALVCAIILSSTPALAADAAPSPADESSDAARKSLGLHLGTGGGTDRLRQSVDVSLDFLLRKPVGSVILAGGLRPHYERFAFGDSSVSGCVDGATCGPSAVLRSQLTANLLSVEVPLILEVPIVKGAYAPFIGVSPTFGYLSATNTRENLVPTNGDSSQSPSRGVFTFAAFAGSALALTPHSGIVFRVGYRFAPTLDDLPGGPASLRGVLASIGYRVDL